jgi:mRNA interferase RelE/StbE
MYSITFNPNAERQFNKLDKETKKRISSFLDRIRIRPFSYDIKQLVGSRYYRARVGKYRLILDIFQDKLIIIVIEIGPRSKIYK